MLPRGKERIVEQLMTAQLLGSGYAAVHMVRVEEEGRGSYWDVQQTGIGRYATLEEAKAEARDWAVSDGIPLEPATVPIPSPV